MRIKIPIPRIRSKPVVITNYRKANVVTIKYQNLLVDLNNLLAEQDAIQNDWRKTKEWKPGWKYIVL